MLGRFAILIAITLVCSYLLGCINGALIVSKYILRDDVRNHGSGNAGLTNFYRVFGGKLTLVVIFCDMLKAVLAVVLGTVFIGQMLAMPVLGKYLAAVSCMLGHMFPCMFQFRGGKGVLSGGAIALMMDWRLALAVWGVFIVLFVATKMVSLGSLGGGLVFIAMTALIYRSVLIAVIGTVIGVLIFWQHRGNIVRILKGEERTFRLRGKSKNSEEEA